MMQKETINTKIEINPKVAEVAEKQRLYGLEWGRIYYENDQPTSTEIAVRNPVVYLNEGHPGKLPESMKQEWFDLLDYSKELVDQIDGNQTEWARNTTEIEKIQCLIRDGKIPSRFKGSISDVIIWSSDLFTRSTYEVAGNTDYYLGNVNAMESWSAKYRNRRELSSVDA